MSDMCNDNRFELVAKYKAELIESTNIDTSADEMAVIDNILFRMWQIGWLDRLKQPTVDAVPVTRCGRCEYYSNEMNCCSYVNGLQNVTKTDYCSYGKCADGERRSE